MFGVSEVDGHIETFFSRPSLIDSEMKVRQALCVAGIAAFSNRLALIDTVADFHEDAVLFQMGIESNRAVIVLYHNVIVLAGFRLSAVVGQVAANLHDQTRADGDNLRTNRSFEIIGKLVSMPAFGITVSLHESIRSPNRVWQYIG